MKGPDRGNPRQQGVRWTLSKVDANALIWWRLFIDHPCRNCPGDALAFSRQVAHSNSGESAKQCAASSSTPALFTQASDHVEHQNPRNKKMAITAWEAVIQGPLPEHAPLQPTKMDLAAGVAVRLTTVPPAKLAEQVVPQWSAV